MKITVASLETFTLMSLKLMQRLDHSFIPKTFEGQVFSSEHFHKFHEGADTVLEKTKAEDC